jgi:hypothetical protein
VPLFVATYLPDLYEAKLQCSAPLRHALELYEYGYQCHSSAVLLCLLGSKADAAGTLSAKRSDPTSCSLDTEWGGVSSEVGLTTHLHLFTRLRMRVFYLHFHVRLFGTVLD